MRKTIKLKDLECANCAAKIETAVSKMNGVVEVKVNFMTQKMILEVEDGKFDDVLTQAKKAAKKIEPDMVFLD